MSLPVERVLLGTFAIPWRDRSTFARRLVLPAAGIVALRLAWYFGYDSMPSGLEWPVWIAEMLLYVVFAVVCHRLVLLGPDADAGPRWSRRETAFAAQLIAVGVVTLAVVVGCLYLATTTVLTLLSNLHAGDAIQEQAASPLQVATYVVYGYVFARVALALPATAVDRRATVRDAWSWTQGNGWRVAIFVGALPWAIRLARVHAYRPGASAWEVVVVALAGVVFLTFEVSALSLCYRELAPKPPA